MYCTAQDVRDSSELLQDVTVVSDEKITPCIVKAQSRIDAALRVRYKVPLVEPVPAVIKSIAQDMAAGFLIANVFGNQIGQEQINLSNQFLKRADADLSKVVTEKQLDGLPGIQLVTTPGSSPTPAISSTTKRPSQVEEIVRQW